MKVLIQGSHVSTKIPGRSRPKLRDIPVTPCLNQLNEVPCIKLMFGTSKVGVRDLVACFAAARSDSASQKFRRDTFRLPSAPWAHESQRQIVTRIAA